MRLTLYALAALSMLLVGQTAAAQSVGGEPGGDPQKMRVDGHVEKTYRMNLELAPKKQYCQAQITIEFLQQDTVAGVKGQITNPECGASAGSYTLTVRYRDQEGELRNEEYEETWQRDDDRDLAFENNYAIGESSDLIRVHARKIVCVCADAPGPGNEKAPLGENDE